MTYREDDRGRKKRDDIYARFNAFFNVSDRDE